MIFPSYQTFDRDVRYLINVKVYSYDSEHLTDLQEDYIDLIEIFYKLNQFYPTGSIVYRDSKQVLDKLLNKPLSYLQIFFKNIVHDNDTGTEIQNEKISFSHDFLIRKISIIKREKQEVTYKLDIVDKNWWKTQTDINITSYGNKKMTVTDILKEAFSQSGLNLVTTNKFNFDATLDYITQCDDNIEQVFDHVMAKSVYDSSFGIQKSLTLLDYNMIKDEYFFYDMLHQDASPIDVKNYPQNNSLFLSMYDRNQLENMINKNEIGIGTVSLIDKMELLQNLKKKTIYNYDMKSNAFSNSNGTIDGHRITNILNNTKVKDAKRVEWDKLQIGEDKDILNMKKFDNEYSYWHNDLNIYKDLVDVLMNNDSLAINTQGNINRIPGVIFIISITNPSIQGDISASTNKFLQEKYGQIIGKWIVSSVRHMIQPSKGKFEDVICLFRNQ